MAKEKPILFSGPMVRAILEGQKTQTRRIVQVQPPSDKFQLTTLADSTARKDKKHIGAHHWAIVKDLNIVEDHGEYFRCPYGYPGDRLWVRETWQARDDKSYYTKADTKLHRTEHPKCAEIWNKKQPPEAFPAWESPIFMPRWASRLTLEIRGVRVERLQEISEADAYAEGVTEWKSPEQTFSPVVRFHELWDEINGKRASWESNPWVWVVEFKKVEAA